MTYSAVAQHPTLARGVNMFDWFMGPNIYEEGHQAAYIDDQGIKKLRRAGFTHIRLPVYGKFIFDTDYVEAPVLETRIADLDTAIDRIISQGLTVVLTLFPEDEMYRLANNLFSGHIIYGNIWSQLAERYQSYATDRIYFELINEPHFQAFLGDTDARASFEALRTILVSAVRSKTRAHWIIIPSYDYNTVQNVIDYNQTISDTKTIYTGHFYEKIAFTHQGVEDFGDPVVVALRNIPYPPRQPVCNVNIAALPDDIEAQMQWYCPLGFGPDDIEAQFLAFQQWAKAKNVPIYLGEFGAYRKYCIQGDAEQWIFDVRTSAERNRIPWAYWSYKGAFALQQDDGSFYETVIRALRRGSA